MARKPPDQQEQPKKRARVQTLHVRMFDGGIETVDRIAEREHRDRSDVVRLMLTYAAAHMPKGYTGR